MATITPTPTLFLGTVTAATWKTTATCTTGIPDSNGYVPPDSCNANYGFYPSVGENAIFAVGFGLTTIAHIIQCILLKKPFCWVVIMGALWECLTFILRAIGAKDQQEANYVTMSTLLFLLAPLWINGFAYMLVARLIYFLHPKQQALGMPARWLAKGFVAADIISFGIQAVGGGMMSDQKNKDTADLGRKIYMAGTGVQLFFVCIFVAVMASFHRQLSSDIRTGALKNKNRWIRPLIWVIYAVLILIIERIIFRMIEFSGGASSENELLQKEEYGLFLDGLPMLIALVLLNVVHPGMVLKGPDSSFPSSKIKCWKG